MLRKDSLFAAAPIMLLSKSSLNFNAYLDYMALNVGFGSLITSRSPREMIEGYSDEKLQEIYQKPLYLGGDINFKPFLNLGRYPETSYVTLLTGSNGEDKVRTVLVHSSYSSTDSNSDGDLRGDQSGGALTVP